MFVACDIDSNLHIDAETGDIKPPLVVRVKDFSEEAVEKFAKQMSAAGATGQPIIPIVIDSYGGDVYALLAMVDIIKSSLVPVATVVQGKAMSCGAVLLACGTEGYRFVGPSATVMIHDISADSSMKKSEEIKADAKEVERLNKIFYEILAISTGQSDDYFRKLVDAKHHADWYLSPQEAVKHNIANYIGIPQLTMAVSVGFKLSLTKAPRDVTADFETDFPPTKKRSR